MDLSEADLAHAAEHLPDHLRMTFVVVDSRGRELGAGKDLAHLQHSLAGAADQAVRRAVRGAIAQAMEDAQAGRNRRGKAAEGTGRAAGSRKKSGSARGRGPGADGRTAGTTGARADGRRDASAGASPSRAGGGAEAAALSALNEDSITAMPVLPRAVVSRADGLSLRAFPALVPQGSADDPRAGVRVMANAAEAAREHRLGLARMLLQRVRLATARVTTRWTGREALMLAASPYRGTDALVADAQLASVLSLVDQLCAPDSVRGPEDFERLVAAARERHEDRVHEILGHVVRAMEAHSEAEGAVAAHPQASLREVVDDVRENTRRLVHAGFLADTPFEALPHLARYLRAGAVRIDRASQSAPALERDLADMDRLEDAAKRLDRARQAAGRRPYDAETARLLSQAQWMAQELRVSLFAQRLGTPNKVSFKRLLGVIADAEAAVRPGGRS
ncbi:PF11898 domain protein [Schaalia georgiae F0490]|uniref:PF11898 domain protein n=1 Tax=Schaalia georgiae F0490 TaxID=1125717 RepID=J1HG72_9ACTO|nr:PF11898 domain protein [Schaalia georgiae F0490]